MPKGTGTTSGVGLGLGHRRLAVIELSDHGAQPMHSRCGRWVLSYNGEIYKPHVVAVARQRSTVAR